MKKRKMPTGGRARRSTMRRGRTRPRPQDARESFAPCSNIKPTRKGQKSSEARIEPRFIDKINYNFNIYEKVFIGNTSKYAAFALASDVPKVYVVAGSVPVPKVNDVKPAQPLSTNIE